MDSEPDAETNTYNPPTMLDSEDSEEETSQEETPPTNWSELSIIERVGLNSVEMSEKDLEAAFTQIALAFRCDQYTLKQRLQAEEHARNLAEENIQLELSRGRETLETLKDMCLDSKRSDILQRLELSLDILGGTVERISNTAEVLGAVHQEARVSRAVELMVAHVESLRKQHDRNVADLEEAKKMVQQQNYCRNIIDLGVSQDPDDSENRNILLAQNSLRRRVSISVISSEIQVRRKQDSKKQRGFSSKKSSPTCPSPTRSSESSCSAVAKDDSNSVDDRLPDPDERPSEATAAQPPPDPPLVPNPESPPPKQATAKKTPNKNSSLDTLRPRHKGKAALSKKGKEKKTMNIYQRISVKHGSPRRQHPLSHWLYRCGWALLCTYMFMLFCVVALIYFVWKVHDGAPEP